MRRCVLVNLLIFFLFSSLPLFSQDKMNGLEYFRQKKYEKAVACFETELKRKRGNRKVQKYLILSYQRLVKQYAENKNWNKAIKYSKKLLELNKNDLILKKNIAVLYNNYALTYSSGENLIYVCNYFREALKYDPDNDQIKKNFSVALTNKAGDEYGNGRFSSAAQLLEKAIIYDDENWNAYIYLGEIAYSSDNLKDAVKYWRKALALNPSLTDLKLRLEKVERENQIENKFNTAKIKYFKVKFEGYKDSENAWKALRILENARYKIGADFKLYPTFPITVIIYTSKQFDTLTNSLDWALGMYDGKIRVKKEDLIKGKKLLRRVLFHEYTHALIHEITKGNIPFWLNVGIAQFEEPDKDNIPHEEKWLRNKLQRKELISISKLETIFAARNDINDLTLAYLESKLFVCYLMDKYGFHPFDNLLKCLGKGAKFDASLKKIFYKDLKKLEKEWLFHLNRN